MSNRPLGGLGPVLLTVLVDLIGFGLVIPLLTFYSEDYGATPTQVTMLMAVYSLAQFLFAPVWGQLSDTYGRRPIMLISIAGTCLTLVGFAAANHLWLLFVFRALNGVCAANIATAQAYVADLTTPENRAKGMGMIGASFGVGLSLGPWIGGELSPLGHVVPIWVAAALSGLNFLWAWHGLPESHPRGDTSGPRRTLDPRVVLRALAHPTVGAAIVLTFVATFAFSMMEATFTLVAEHAWNMSAQQVGRIFGLIGLIGIVIQGGLIGRLVRAFGEPRLLMAGYLITAAGLSLLGVTTSAVGIYGGCALVATGMSLANPSLQSIISKGAHPTEQGAVLGANQSLSALARALAPTAGGLLFSTWFMGGAFVGGAVLMLVALGMATRLTAPATAESSP
jgi:MFS transporter, DHA1 family, tetracycline resistance protein